MGQVSDTMRRGQGRHFHWCPGCNRMHPLPDTWTFNGNLSAPTFSPSFMQDGHDPERRCHYFIRDGQIQFCGDSHHELAGQTVPMPPLPAGHRDDDWSET